MQGISYIITTYNRHDLLSRAIDSIIVERIFPSELLIIDDCSDLEVQLSAKAKEAFGDQIHVFRNQQNLGVIGARNAGLNAAKYDFVMFLDDDDQSFPQRSKVLLPYIIDSNYAFVAGKCEMWTNQTKKIVPITSHQELSPVDLLLYPAHINGVIWRKAAFSALGGMDERVPYLGEHISSQMMLFQGQKALQIDAVVSQFTYIDNGLTANVTKRKSLQQQLISFYEVLVAESANTPYQGMFTKLAKAVNHHQINTFDDYLELITPLLVS